MLLICDTNGGTLSRVTASTLTVASGFTELYCTICFLVAGVVPSVLYILYLYKVHTIDGTTTATRKSKFS